MIGIFTLRFVLECMAIMYLIMIPFVALLRQCRWIFTLA